jgi:hypothetical protein
MVACAWGRCAVHIGTLLVLAGWLSGCATTDGGPERLYPVSDEVARTRALLEGPDGLEARYYAARTDTDRLYYRNEIIAGRMYLIDVEYSTYEAALTSERQKFQFAGSVVGQGLNTAGALFTPAATTRILSGAAGAVGATKGYYDSDLVVAKTIQIVEGQMRAQRDTLAQRILSRRTEPAATYPLSAAMSDLEDYYRAGTFNSGLIDASAQAGNAATVAAAAKTYMVSYGTNASTQALAACLKKKGAADQLASLMTPRSHAAVAALVFDVTAAGESARGSLMARAKAAGICP